MNIPMKKYLREFQIEFDVSNKIMWVKSNIYVRVRLGTFFRYLEDSERVSICALKEKQINTSTSKKDSKKCNRLLVYKCTNQLSNQKTSIIISHRLGPARLCDRILVMKQGEIIEVGNHKELFSLNGEYAQMYYTQSQWYQDTDFETRGAL